MTGGATNAYQNKFALITLNTTAQIHINNPPAPLCHSMTCSPEEKRFHTTVPTR